MRVSNSDARASVQGKLSFKGNNTFGEWIGDVYAVFSYGHHWPLFAFVDGIWFENQEKYSPTTSKHRGQLHPLEDTEKVTLQEIRRLAGV